MADYDGEGNILGSIRPTIQVIIAILTGLLVACSQTAYVDRNGERQNANTLNLFERVVEYDIDLGLVSSPPGCTAVGAVSIAPPTHTEIDVYDLIRRSLLAQTRTNFPDMEIFEVAADEKQAIFDAQIQGCPFLLIADLITRDEAYLLIWSRKQISLTVRLIRLEDNQLLWSAHHTASRSEGGLPLSPFGAVTTIFLTKDFAEDKDIMPSIIDDAMRRIFTTFPVQALTRKMIDIRLDLSPILHHLVNKRSYHLDFA